MMKETLKDSPYFPLYILYSKFLTLLATLEACPTYVQERKYCLISTSYLAGLFDIFIFSNYNFRWAPLLTSLIQYGEDSFQIW